MTDIPRDRYGQPIIRDAETGQSSTYVRTSTIAKSLDDAGGLPTWASTQTLKGLINRPDLFEYARTQQGNEDEVKSIASKAKDAAASDKAANLGTVVHYWAEQLDLGLSDGKDMPDDIKPLLRSYVRATRALITEAAELFVVCDELQVAGSLDRLYRLPDGAVVVGDIKTGKWANSYGAHSVAVQTATYAHSVRYEPEFGRRAPLHPDLDMTRTLLVHMPINGDETRLFILDAEAGWAGAQLAAEVIRWRRSPRPVSPYDPELDSENFFKNVGVSA